MNMRKLLSLLAVGLILDWSAVDPALANFTFNSTGTTTMLSLDGSQGGSSLCAAASTECGETAIINAAGTVIGVAGHAIIVDGSAVTQPVSGTVTAAQATAASLNATVVGTGTFAVQAASTLNAETTKVIGTVRNLGNVGAIFDGVIGAATAPANMIVGGGVFNSTPLTLTNGQSSAAQLDSSGFLNVHIQAGAGSGGTALGDNAAWTAGTTNMTPAGCEFTTGGATAITTAHAATVGCTAARAMFTDLESVAATALGTPAAYGSTPTGNALSANVFVTNTNANGSATGAFSSPVVIASDQAAVAVKAASGSFASGSIASGALASGSIAAGAGVSGAFVAGAIADLAHGQATMANSVPVAFASNQSALATTLGVATTGGAATAGAAVPNNTTAVVVKSGAGTLYGVQLYGIGSAPAYLKIYNATSATCGSGTPVKRLSIPAAATAANGAGNNVSFGPQGIAFSTGITYCITTGITDADNTAPAASTFVANIDYD